MKRRLLGFLGIAALLLGLACLNYTSAFNAEHHVQWAREQGVPEPAPWMFYGGCALVALGAAAVGFRLGSRCRGQL